MSRIPKPVVGIIGKDIIVDDITFKAINQSNLKYLDGKVNYIGIINYQNNSEFNLDTLSLCDGIIFQGGNIIYPHFFKILDYAYQNNLPVLGICLGCQLIGLYANQNEEKELKLISDHQSNKINAHLVKFKDNTLMSRLFGNELMVNSRHNYCLEDINKPFIVSGYALDKTVEAVELIDDNHFIVGVQWHPEDLDNMEPLYNEFIKQIISRKKQ